MAWDLVPPRRSRRGSGVVTLHDVARLAGVAPITASRAVNTPHLVSEEVRKKVGDAIARTGYMPNRLTATPASDFICGTLQLAAGMNLHVFTTGRRKTWAERWKLHNALMLFKPAPVT